MNFLKSFLLLILFLAQTGCGLIYTNIRVPRAYRSATPNEVKAQDTDPMVTGRACYQSVLFLFSWGDSGYAQAAKDALKDKPNAMLYDVKADMQLRSILGLYARSCTIVTGKATQP